MALGYGSRVMLGILGPLIPDDITRPAQRRLLSILILARESTIDRDLLVDRMWGTDPPQSARNALHVHLNGLRKALPQDIISTTASGYRIAVDIDELDLSKFDRLANAARAEPDASQRLSFADAALRLWRGDPYQELATDSFVLPEILRLEERRLELTELRMQALLTLDRHEEAIPELRELVERFPLRERFYEDLMLALYRSGRQTDALRQFQSARRILGETVGVEPGPALKELEERILFQDPTLGKLDGQPLPRNLPTFTTSFVGRDDDMESIVKTLDVDRLVSIVGGPGFGKTRLAVEVGLSWGEENIGGVWFASLADARSSEDVRALIAAAGRIQANTSNLEELARAFAVQRGLLILDNCEQVIGSCGAFVEAVLGAGGNLRILATSRSRLNVAGEEVWRLDPLPVPAPLSDDDDISRAALNGAVRLFVDRARSVDRTFVLSSKSLPALVDLSRRLAGIPLAIELAARWVPALGLGELASMLDPADAMTTDSEGTEPAGSLRVAIEWGLSLLPPDDLSLLRDLAIFSGSFGISDVAEVCAGGRARAPLAAAVARVVDSSLLHATRQDGGAVRYHMLVPIREFLLASRGEDWDTLEAAYASHYLAKAVSWQEDRFQGVVDLSPIDDDIDNLRAALDIGLVRGWADDVARALVPLNNYFFQRYLTWESKAWLERVVECDLSPSVEASALRALASSAEVLGDLADAVDMFNRAISLFETAGDDVGKARCLVSLAGAYAHRGDWELGAATAQHSYDLMEASGNPAALAGSSYYIAENLTGGGDFAAAVPHFTRSAECFESCDEFGRGAYVMSRFALFAALDGDETLARAAVDRAAGLMAKSDSEYREAKILGSAALVDAIWGDVRVAAAKLLRANERIEGIQRDRIFDFLLPAAAVFVRAARWESVAELVVGVERAVATTESAMPVPWTETMSRWVLQAVAELGEDEGTIRRRNSVATIDTITNVTVAALSDIAS
jgi:predicted ATPase/DNA-binding SARP family transcriptional activator